MKKIMLMSGLLISTISIASITSNEPFDPVKEGLPLPDDGMKVVPLNKINIPPIIKNKLKITLKQMKEKGYYLEETQESKLLIKSSKSNVLPPGSNNPEDTNLKSNIEDVGLAFEFKGLPVNKESVIGYAAVGLYDKGWTGITEIFKENELGICQYTLFNNKLSHGSSFIAEENARYDVNGKVTTLDVKGSINSGFIYTIGWGDKISRHDLRCAHMNFDKDKTQKLIALAKKIDKSVIVQ